MTSCDAAICPACGGECLHPKTSHMHGDAPKFNNGDDGITITFWCETCDNIPVIQIFYHEGYTYFMWRPIDKEATKRRVIERAAKALQRYRVRDDVDSDDLLALNSLFRQVTGCLM